MPTNTATVNLSARVPQDRLDAWFKTDSRFRSMWFRQRGNLHAQSQSGYDLALACFGHKTGLTEQEVVDLIVYHRAIHKLLSRTRVDYFERTLSKAASQEKLPTPRILGPNGGPCEVESPEHKAGIWARLFEVLSVRIEKITKISGESPIYYMKLAERRISFPNVGKLISQTYLRNAIAGLTGKLIPSFRPAQWEEIAQALLNACLVEGGEEMEMEGPDYG